MHWIDGRRCRDRASYFAMTVQVSSRMESSASPCMAWLDGFHVTWHTNLRVHLEP
jgi:hypothetical protein